MESIAEVRPACRAGRQAARATTSAVSSAAAPSSRPAGKTQRVRLPPSQPTARLTSGWTRVKASLTPRQPAATPSGMLGRATKTASRQRNPAFCRGVAPALASSPRVRRRSARLMEKELRMSSAAPAVMSPSRKTRSPPTIALNRLLS